MVFRGLHSGCTRLHPHRPCRRPPFPALFSQSSPKPASSLWVLGPRSAPLLPAGASTRCIHRLPCKPKPPGEGQLSTLRLGFTETSRDRRPVRPPPSQRPNLSRNHLIAETCQPAAEPLGGSRNLLLVEGLEYSRITRARGGDRGARPPTSACEQGRVCEAREARAAGEGVALGSPAPGLPGGIGTGPNLEGGQRPRKRQPLASGAGRGGGKGRGSREMPASPRGLNDTPRVLLAGSAAPLGVPPGGARGHKTPSRVGEGRGGSRVNQRSRPPRDLAPTLAAVRSHS